MKISFLSISRRMLQTAIILLIIIIPAASFELSSISLKGADLASFDKNLLVKTYHEVITELNIPADIPAKIRGSLWSLDVGGYRLSEPLAIVETLTSDKYLKLSFLLSGIPLLFLTLLLGRVFCGWLCPINPLFEAINSVRVFLDKKGVLPETIIFSYRNKYYILAIGIIVSFFASLPLFSLLYPPLILSREIYSYVYTVPGFGLVIILLIILFEFFISPRSWCRYFCPGGALYSFLGRKRMIGVSLNKKGCTNSDACTTCFDACELGFNPVAGGHLSECDNCGKCIVSCPEGVLEFRRISKG